MKSFWFAGSLTVVVACSSLTDTSEPEVVVAKQEVVEATSGEDMEHLCTPQDKVTPICVVNAPEDAEWLPDGSGLILSEFAGFEGTEGRISLLDIESGEVSLLYDSSLRKGADDTSEWGAKGVVEKKRFAPHGINLSQRADGRWQLLVVNHAARETIDVFELLQIDGVWTLLWRGGVDAVDESKFNDVAAFGDGFYTTRYFIGNRDTVEDDFLEQRKNGIVKKWTRGEGWADLAGTEGVLLNGILWNEAANELVVAELGLSLIHVFTSDGEKKHTIEGVRLPDNISWNEKRDGYLVSGNDVSVYKLADCAEAELEICAGEFAVFEIAPVTGSKKTRYSSDGEFWGPASNVVERDGRFYLGSSRGSRLLIVE